MRIVGGIIRRTLPFVAAVCLFTAGYVVMGVQPAHADTVYNLAGNFAGDGRAEIFQYRAGSGADYMYEFTKTGDSVTAELYSYVVNGTYAPFVGDFDADGYDEIFWYTPGSETDYIWHFSSLTAYTSTTATVGGTYWAVTGDFTGDTYEDVFWHGPGTAQDYLWDYDSSGYTSHPLTFNQAYTPVAGTFNPDDGASDVILYGPGSTTDFLVDFEPGDVIYNTYGVSVTRTGYQPFALDHQADGHDDVFWYLPGEGPDALWDFNPGGGWDNLAMEVDGTYSKAGGDIFGDGHGDAFWQGSLTTVWDWHMTPTGLVRTIWELGSSGLAESSRANGADGMLVGTLVETIPEGP